MLSKEFEEEIEVLKSIYTEIEFDPDIALVEEPIVAIVLYPATCNDDETRYVTLRLEFKIPPTYPSSPPTILFKNPRGLSETKLDELHATLEKKCVEEFLDMPMLFQMIHMVQEFLTSNNLPATDCPICLNSFHSADVFYRSKCYHYFHSSCLGKFLQNIVKNNNNEEGTIPQVGGGGIRTEAKSSSPEFLCPVCREELDPDSIDIDKLVDAPPPHGEADEDEAFLDRGEAEEGEGRPSISLEWLQQREQMKQLFEKQERQGGIIDLNEKAKLLVISTPPPPQLSTTGEDLSPVSAGAAALNSSDQSISTSSTASTSNSPKEPQGKPTTTSKCTVRAGNDKSTGPHYRNRSTQQRSRQGHYSNGSSHELEAGGHYHVSFKPKSHKTHIYKRSEQYHDNTGNETAAVVSKAQYLEKESPSEMDQSKNSARGWRHHHNYKQGCESKTSTVVVNDTDKVQCKASEAVLGKVSEAVLGVGVTTTEPKSPTEVEDEQQPHGRIRNFNRHHHYHHYRGHNYYNHRSRGYIPKKHEQHNHCNKSVSDQ